MCCNYDLPKGVFDIGQKVKLISPQMGWFDFSIKREIPAGTVGVVSKIEKRSPLLEEMEYTIQFDSEFGFFRVKHGDLINA